MNKKIATALGLSEDSTPEQIEASIVELKASHDNLAAAADKAEKEKQEGEAEAAVNEAVNAGALTDADKPAIVAAYKTDKTGTALLLARIVAMAKTAKPDGHAAPLKISAQGGQLSGDAFRAAAAAAEDGLERAALYREFPQMMPDARDLTKLAAFIKSNPGTARALCLTK